MTPTPSVVAVDDLVVEYITNGNIVRPLDRFSMHAAAGSLVALRGPSGSGKTTMLSILSAMISPSVGRVNVAGIDVLALKGAALEDYRRRTIGIVFQSFNLLQSLNARENVAAPLLMAGVKAKAALTWADFLLEEVGLAGRGDHKPTQLSGGQQQRVAVARGLVGDPTVLLADEPTANLGPDGAGAVGSLLRRLRDNGRTVIISTHDDRLLPLADQVVSMSSPQRVPETPVVELADPAWQSVPPYEPAYQGQRF